MTRAQAAALVAAIQAEANRAAAELGIDPDDVRVEVDARIDLPAGELVDVRIVKAGDQP